MSNTRWSSRNGDGWIRASELVAVGPVVIPTHVAKPRCPQLSCRWICPPLCIFSGISDLARGKRGWRTFGTPRSSVSAATLSSSPSPVSRLRPLPQIWPTAARPYGNNGSLGKGGDPTTGARAVQMGRAGRAEAWGC